MKKEVLLEQEHKKDDVREKNQLDANKLSKKRVSNPLRVTTKLSLDYKCRCQKSLATRFMGQIWNKIERKNALF